VGVFANEEPGKIIETVRQHGLNIVQLHGDESIKDCRMIKSAGCRIIKAFGIDDRFRFKTLKPYLELCDYFLLDTRSEKFGGTGKQFNWERIQDYHYDVPFFLSGGICYEDARRIRELEHPAFFGVDINSRFEREAGVKDINLVKGFIDKMKGLKT
jgi:phosphoribosylanthranilate isomerase